MTRTNRASRLTFLDCHRGGRALGFQLALALLGGATPALAQQAPESGAALEASSPEVLVDCPELDGEARAAIEARQMSELLSQGLTTGTLRLVCSPDRVTGTWEEAGRVLDSRFLSRNAGEGAVELLHWLASVLLEMRREREAGRVPEGSAAVAAPAVANPGEPDASSNLEAEASEKPTSADASSPAAASSAASNDGSSTTAKHDATPGPFTLDASLAYSHFGTEIPGALGPRLGLRFRLATQLHVGVFVDAKVGIQPSSGPSVGFGVVDLTAGLSVTYDFLPFLSATLAPILVLSNFMAPTETAGPTSPFPAGGASLLVRGKLPFRDAHPFVELGVQAATPARQVTLSGTPALTVPEWQAQVAIGVEVPL